MSGIYNDLSEKSKTPVPGKQVRDVDDYYPDVQPATPLEDKDTGSNYRLDTDQVPTTRVDMHGLFTWEYGDGVYGNTANSHQGMYNYRRDIERAYGKQGEYKDKYLDTFKKISDELDRFDAM